MAALPLNTHIDTAPMVELNTTPLIDVMLVLIIMLIITMPPSTHAVKLDLPNDRSTRQVNEVRNRLVVTASGGILFNGRAVSASQLRALLEASAQLPREPELQLQPEANAPYAAVDEVLVAAKRARLTKLGFVGNDAYRRF